MLRCVLPVRPGLARRSCGIIACRCRNTIHHSGHACWCDNAFCLRACKLHGTNHQPLERGRTICHCVRCFATCNYTVRMTDSYGDGWPDHVMSVRQGVGGVHQVFSATMASGFGPTDVTFPVCPGVTYELFWVAGGIYSGEVGVEILDNNLVSVYSKPPGTGTPGTSLPLL